MTRGCFHESDVQRSLRKEIPVRAGDTVEAGVKGIRCDSMSGNDPDVIRKTPIDDLDVIEVVTYPQFGTEVISCCMDALISATTATVVAEVSRRDQTGLLQGVEKRELHCGSVFVLISDSLVVGPYVRELD